MQFNVGDRVVIRRDSEYYGRDPEINPDDSVAGTVTSRAEGTLYCYQVDWDGGGCNCYREVDLCSPAVPDFIYMRDKYVLKFSSEEQYQTTRQLMRDQGEPVLMSSTSLSYAEAMGWLYAWCNYKWQFCGPSAYDSKVVLEL